MELLADYLFRARGPASIWASRYLDGDPALDLLEDPDGLFQRPGCQIVKDQKKIKVGRVELQLQGRNRTVYIKRFNAFSWRYRIGSLFMRSGAVRSLEGAAILLQAGFATSQPVAGVEFRVGGMLEKSFFLSEEIANGETADRYWRERLVSIPGAYGARRRRLFLENLGRLFRRLHEREIYHNDLKDANILVAASDPGREETFYLLDLEGIQRHGRLSRRRRIKNLVQLDRTLGKMLRPSDRLRCLRTYLGSQYSDRLHRRRWIRDLLSETRRRNRRSSRKG